MVSIVVDSAELAEDVFPAGSVMVAVMSQVPSVSVGRSHEVAVPMT